MEQKLLKIAAVTDDGEMIHRHFGRARFYTIYTIENGRIVGREQVDKAAHHHSHQHDHDQHSNVELHDHDHDHGHDHDHDHHSPEQQAARHADMFEPLKGCHILLARGMGHGAHNGLNAIGVQPIITDIPRIEDAVQAYLDGSIVDHPEKLH